MNNRKTIIIFILITNIIFLLKNNIFAQGIEGFGLRQIITLNNIENYSNEYKITYFAERPKNHYDPLNSVEIKFVKNQLKLTTDKNGKISDIDIHLTFKTTNEVDLFIANLTKTYGNPLHTTNDKGWKDWMIENEKYYISFVVATSTYNGKIIEWGGGMQFSTRGY